MLFITTAKDYSGNISEGEEAICSFRKDINLDTIRPVLCIN